MTTNANDPLGLAPRPGIPVRDEVKTPPSADALSRRTALKALSAAAFFAATGCGARKPVRPIVSLAETPEYQKPGEALWYASTWTEGHWPYGVMVKVLDGRPVKIEGLPGHPLNDGTSSAAMQSSLLSLYDADRLRVPVVDGAATDWAAADKAVVEALKAASSVVLLTPASLGPSERALVKRFLDAKPGVKHFVHESAADRDRRAAWAQVYGGDGVLVPDLAQANVVLSVDADVLGSDGPTLDAMRGFATRRTVDGDPAAERLSRVWVAESAMTLTGSNADHRIPLKPSAMAGLVEALRKLVDGDGAALQAFGAAHGVEAATLGALASDLKENRGAAVVLAGAHLPAGVHASVALLNEALGAPGKTLRWNPAPPTLPASDPAAIAAALAAKPDVVLCLGVNPVHDFPGGGFAALLAGAKLAVGHGLTENETLASCGVRLPSTHGQESWNDASPAPGVRAIQQPTVAPLFDARQEAHSLLAWTKALRPAAVPATVEDWHDFVKAQVGLDGSAWWDLLRKGWTGEAKYAAPPAADREKAAALASAAAPAAEGLDLVVVPHASLLDGRFAGRAWLLELPDAVSRLVWDNAAQVGPATAAALGVKENDRVRVTVGGTSIEAPVLVQTGTAPQTVVIPLGFGRAAGAGAGNGVGVNAAPLLAATGGGLRAGAKVEKIGGTHPLVRTQRTFDQDGRPIALEGTAEEYREHPEFAKHRVHVPELSQLHDEYDYSKTYKWAMAIDLNACTGCGACTIACQSENNIPVVGKEECATGREMSWIRIDRYEDPAHPENPSVLQQPMLCQHCDNAPCENVCPVNATAHSPEGLNEQVYNRCVGTRYCANNCPYKVRRFNYLAYVENGLTSATQELMYNPNVTVRSRGVMEKCTFCVQRINAARFEAANKGETVPDGAVRPACQQACPAQAIVFGDVNTEGSEIAKKRASPLGYHVLEELNVRPNVTYLAKVRNPHPSLATTGGSHGAHGAAGAHAGGHR